MSGWLLPFRHAEPHGWFVVGGLCAIPFLLKINKTGCHPVCRAKQGLIQFGPNDMWLISCAFFSESLLIDQFRKIGFGKILYLQLYLFKNLITITIE